MQIHLVLGLNGPESVATLADRIGKLYPNRSRKLGDKPAWLVAENETASIISEKLGISTGDSGISALVTSISDYFGRAEPDLWSWIKLQWETSADAAPEHSAAA